MPKENRSRSGCLNSVWLHNSRSGYSERDNLADHRKSNVDVWLGRETDHVRNALEGASRHFDESDSLTANLLEGVYGQESSFGTLMGERSSSDAAGHFQLRPDTAKRYGLTVSKTNDQRFDIDYASSAAARYLKDLDTFYSRETTLIRGVSTVAVKDPVERKKFVLGSYNAGEGRIARAQRLAQEGGLNPNLWSDVEKFLEKAGAKPPSAEETREFVPLVLSYEIEFAQKSPADKNLKQRKPSKVQNRCTEGHWVTIDERPVFICD